MCESKERFFLSKGGLFSRTHGFRNLVKYNLNLVQMFGLHNVYELFLCFVITPVINRARSAGTDNRHRVGGSHSRGPHVGVYRPWITHFILGSV